MHDALAEKIATLSTGAGCYIYKDAAGNDAIGSAIQNQPGGSTQRQKALLNKVQDRAAKQLLPAAQIGQ